MKSQLNGYEEENPKPLAETTALTAKPLVQPGTLLQLLTNGDTGPNGDHSNGDHPVLPSVSVSRVFETLQNGVLEQNGGCESDDSLPLSQYSTLAQKLKAQNTLYVRKIAHPSKPRHTRNGCDMHKGLPQNPEGAQNAVTSADSKSTAHTFGNLESKPNIDEIKSTLGRSSSTLPYNARIYNGIVNSTIQGGPTTGGSNRPRRAIKRPARYGSGDESSSTIKTRKEQKKSEPAGMDQADSRSVGRSDSSQFSEVTAPSSLSQRSKAALSRTSKMRNTKKKKRRPLLYGLVCPVDKCRTRFLSSKGLSLHLDKHPDYQVICHKCGKSFGNNLALVVHNRSFHKDSLGDTTSDPKCAASSPVTFRSLNFLDFSARSFPAVAQKWCEENQHRASSTKLNCFTCPHCKLTFPIQSAQRRHMRRFHGTAMGGSICDICNQTFDSKKLVTSHRRKFNIRTRDLSSDKLTFCSSIGLVPRCAMDVKAEEAERDDYLNSAVYKPKYKPEDIDKNISNYVELGTKLRKPRREAR